jgi:hypothetical protein
MHSDIRNLTGKVNEQVQCKLTVYPQNVLESIHVSSSEGLLAVITIILLTNIFFGLVF